MRRLTTPLVTSTLILLFAGSACQDATESLQPEPLLGLPVTGAIAVTTATSGEDIDPDGYTATLDFVSSQPAPTNGSVTFGAVLTGPHIVQLNGVAGNCSVSGGNSRTVVVLPGGTVSADFSVNCVGTAPPPPPPPGARVNGVGTIGDGAPAPGGSRVEFDVDVGSDLTGRVFIRDWRSVREDGSVGTITVDAADPETRITAYRNQSALCEDPTRGVEFDGIARVNSGGDSDPTFTELVSFTVSVCDNGTPGVGVDVFFVTIPANNYGAGPEVLSEGDLTKN